MFGVGLSTVRRKTMPEKATKQQPEEKKREDRHKQLVREGEYRRQKEEAEPSPTQGQTPGQPDSPG
jgi:hypothetical protein